MNQDPPYAEASSPQTCTAPHVTLDRFALDLVSEIEQQLGLNFTNKAVLLQAFIHETYHGWNWSLGNNQRLEYLGDAILGAIVKEYLYRQTTEDEGGMTAISSYMLSKSNLASVADTLKLYRWLIMDPRHMVMRRPTEKERCDLLEALIGAIFIDGGRVAAKSFIDTHIIPTVAIAKSACHQHPKAKLQLLTHRHEKQNPQYKIDIAYERGQPVFMATVMLGRRILGKGEGASKAQATIAAAKNALENYDSNSSYSKR